MKTLTGLELSTGILFLRGQFVLTSFTFKEGGPHVRRGNALGRAGELGKTE